MGQATGQLKEVEAQLDRYLEADERGVLLRSVEGIGLDLGAGLLALCFDGADLKERDHAAKRLGAVPVTRHSGQQRHPTVRMRRSASSRARQRAMYEHARKHNQSAGTAFRRISRCLLRILTAMLRDGVDYDEARYIKALKDKGVVWAQDLELPEAA